MPTIDISEEDMNLFKRLMCKWFNIGCETEPPPPPPPPPPTGTSRGDLFFGYYAGGAVLEFADHCNILHIGSWGDWETPGGRQVILDNFINQIQAALGHGIANVILTLDWCVFTPTWQRLPDAEARGNLRSFFNALDAQNLLWPVRAVYPVDEPDNAGISNADMVAVNSMIRSVMSEYVHLNYKPLAVTYGDRSGKGGPTPGIASFDWCGFDNYGAPIFTNGEYDYFVSKLTPTQRTTILPGGSTPWKQDPTPFYNKAQADPRVVLIFPFMWFDNGGQQGVKTDGMAPAYRAVGMPIKAAQP